eukprot:6460499-Amphidinium_carterae.1
MLLLAKHAETNASKMGEMATALHAHIDTCMKSDHKQSAIWEEGLTEASEIMQFWMMLLKPTVHVNMSVVSSIMDANGGNKLLVQHAVQQSTFPHGLVTQVRKSVVAQASLGPEIEKAVKDLEEGAAEQRVLDIIDKIPVLCQLCIVLDVLCDSFLAVTVVTANPNTLMERPDTGPIVISSTIAQAFTMQFHSSVWANTGFLGVLE